MCLYIIRGDDGLVFFFSSYFLVYDVNKKILLIIDLFKKEIENYCFIRMKRRC